MGGICHIWGQRRYIWVLSNMGWVLSLMGSIPHMWQIPPIYDKPIFDASVMDIYIYISIYPLRKRQRWVCHLWAGFVTYGVREDTFGFCQIWVGFCHLWGVSRYWQIPPLDDKPQYTLAGKEITTNLLGQWETSILIMWFLFDQSQCSIFEFKNS